MEFILTQKFKLFVMLGTSIVCFGYFKYIKKDDLGWKIGFSIGGIIIAISIMSASLSYSPGKIANFIVLLEKAPYAIERFILIGHIFLLVGFMSLVDSLLYKVFKTGSKKQ